MAAEPYEDPQLNIMHEIRSFANGHASPRTICGTDYEESTGSDEDSNDDDPVELHENHATDAVRIAIACDDGCVRIYCVFDSKKLTYKRTLLRVIGRALSVTWSPDATRIFFGSSDRSVTIVSADSSGNVQFWDSHLGTLLQAHSYHKGDVNALAANPSHNRVFYAGSDGQMQLRNGSMLDK